MSEPTPTIEVKDKEQNDKEASNTYVQELRLALSARVTKEDGTLGEPGALPYEQLVKIYRGEPLETKD
jgi:hypothetical protein